MASQTKKKGRPSKADSERKKRAARLAAEKKRRRDVTSIALLALGALLFALTVVSGEGVWRALSDALFGVFGALGYAVGPALVIIAIVVATEKTPSLGKGFCWAGFALSVWGAVFLFGAARASASFGEDIKALYAAGVTRTGGGAFSALLGRTLESLFGLVPARVTIVLLMFVFILIISGRTVADLVNGAKKPIEKIKTAYDDRAFERANAETEKETENGESPPWQAEKPRLKAFWRKNIDVPLDGEKPQSAPAQPLDDRQTAPEPETGEENEGPEILASKDKPTPHSDVLAHQMKFTHGDSRIDIPLGPDFDPTTTDPLDESEILTRDAVPTGPAADIVSDVFGRGQMIDETFADFGAGADNMSAGSPFYDASHGEDKTSSQDGSKPVTEKEKELGWTPPEPEEPKAPEYRFPPAALLDKPTEGAAAAAEEELRDTAERLVSTLKSFGVATKVSDYSRGPTVTRYELQPEPGVRLSRIVSLADDLALNLAAEGVRIEAPIPGKPAVGVEVPNKLKTTVKLRSAIESPDFKNAPSPLTISLGEDISGRVRVVDISKMPHLLIAGATGMGKSVCINSIVMSLVYKSSPDDVQLVLIDPKMVEFTCYAGLPHLHTPVVTDPKKAAGALAAAVMEMQKRYRLFAELSARNIGEYNKSVEKYKRGENVNSEAEAELAERLQLKPRIVVIIDELNDLMMTAPNEVEDSICRLAQMGRAAGIHLVVATQRPSVDVITGTIKNNIPTRIAFKVSSQVDSRTILDTSGAEKLVGNGDMLFLPVGATKPLRVQGCFVSDAEVVRVVDYLKKYSSANYNEEFIRETEENAAREKGQASQTEDGADAMLEQAIETVIEAGQASTSLLQRKLRLGYSRAARIMDDMENMGIIGPADGSRPREVRMTRAQFQERLMNQNADD